MAKGSRRFNNLARRLSELKQNFLHFLPEPPVSKVSYTDQELDSTRAFVVLTHAEIESFCEDIALKKANAACAAYPREVRPSLRKLVAYHVGKHRRSWSDVTAPPQAVVDGASKAFRETIKSNHGLKRNNLEQLLYPLGLVEADFSSTWFAQMDSFGTKRGELAHSRVGVTTAPDPLSELQTVQQLLLGLLELDRKLAQLR